ncbi:MAG: putative acetyltransferase, GNAT [Ardenticatenaceae bacterium]|nr:MAG: putative acetyltransferase, GNAT [Ardenticatenaceae bacterium]
MSSLNYLENQIDVADKPTLPGLCFRHYRGTDDLPHMVDIVNGSREADQADYVATLEDMTADYSHLTNCNPATDMIFVEIDGDVVGYGRCWWDDIKADGIRYSLFANLLPQWRGHGIRRAMVRHLQDRLRTISREHPAERRKFFNCWANQGQVTWQQLLEEEGFQAVRYGFDMVRPHLDNIPTMPLPDGIEVRTGTEAEWRAIWEAAREAFRDHWGMPEWPEESFIAWTKYPTFTPELWQVAWDGDEVAGGVLNFIDEAENKEHGRQRGYTETIFVRRPWRRQGVAKALITRSFQILQDAGMEEAALGVDAESPTGALHLYRSLGFKEVKRGVTLQKPL